jgi:DNA-binding HxlR family transcriptional regulator
MATYDADMSEATLGNTPLRVENCSIERALAVVGEKWTFLVLREAFRGVRRFADMQAMTGAPRQVLSARLTRLVEEGLLRKVPYREPGQRQRDEYRLTQMGLDLYPTLVALMQWGDRYLADQEGPATLITHRGCGALVEQHFRCADGHEISGPREVTPIPGPGAGVSEPARAGSIGG